MTAPTATSDFHQILTLKDLEEGQRPPSIDQLGRKWTVGPTSQTGRTIAKVSSCSVAGLFFAIGVAGVVLYNVTTGDLKTAGLVAMCVGFPICCCGGTIYKRTSIQKVDSSYIPTPEDM